MIRERKRFLKFTFQETKLFHEAIRTIIDGYLYESSQLAPFKSGRGEWKNDEYQHDYLIDFIHDLESIEDKVERNVLCAGR